MWIPQGRVTLNLSLGLSPLSFPPVECSFGKQCSSPLHREVRQVSVLQINGLPKSDSVFTSLFSLEESEHGAERTRTPSSLTHQSRAQKSSPAGSSANAHRTRFRGSVCVWVQTSSDGGGAVEIKTDADTGFRHRMLVVIPHSQGRAAYFSSKVNDLSRLQAPRSCDVGQKITQSTQASSNVPYVP